MNKKNLKFIALSFFIILFSSYASQETQEISSTRLDEFEARCLHEDVEAAVNDEFCLKEYQFLSSYLAQEEMSETNSCLHADTTPGLNQVNDLKDSISEAATELSCTEEDQEFVQNQCGDQLKCNMARSLVSATESLAPSFISNKVKSGLQSALKVEDSESCFDSAQPDCLSQIYHSFIGTLLATFDSLRDLGKVFTGAFWSIKNYLTNKSDDLHKAANTTQEEATSFIKNPGQFIYEKFLSFKSGVDSWMKNNLFCQEWEGAAYAKESTCLEPLEHYSCLDCNDGLNAFCAGAGFLLSEGLLNVATAGVATGVGFATRVGARVLGQTAQKISSKIPGLSAKLNERSRLKKRKAREKEAIRLARGPGILERTQEKVQAFAQMMGKTKVGAVAALAYRGVSKPVRVVDDLTNKTMESILTLAAKVPSTTRLGRTVKRLAVEDLRTIQGVRSARSNGARRALVASRVLKTGNRNRRRRAPTDPTPIPTTESKTHPHSQETAHQSQTNTHSENSENRLHENQGSHNERKDEQRTAQNDREREREHEDELRRKKEEEEQRRRERLQNIEAMTKAALAADLANKTAQMGSGDDTIEVSEVDNDTAVQNIINGESSLDEGGLEDQLNRRGLRQKEGESAKDLLKRKAKVYNDEQKREEIIKRLMGRRGLQEDEAQRYVNSQRDFINEKLKETHDPFKEQLRIGVRELSDRVEAMNNQLRDDTLEEKEEDEKEESLIERNALSTPQEKENNQNRAQALGSSRGSSGAPSSGRFPASSLSSAGGAFFPSSSSDAFVASSEIGVAEEIMEFDPSEEIKGREEKKEVTGNVPEADPEDQTDKEKPASSRLEKMELLSLLLLGLEEKKLTFSPLPTELNQLTRETLANHLKQTDLPVENFEFSSLQGLRQTYTIYKHKESHEIIVLNAQNAILKDIPADIISDYF